MAAQVGVASVVVEPRGVLQPLEHRCGALRCKTGLRHDAEADAIGFALHVPRKAQLVLHEGCLAPHDHRLPGVRTPAPGRSQDAEDHRGEHQRHLPALPVQHARNVTLCDVRQLMAQHRGQFVAAASHGHQPEIQPQIPSRQGKSVDVAVTPEQHRPGKTLVELGRQFAAQARGCQQAQPDVLHILSDHRIVDVVGVAVQLAGNAVPQLALGAGSHFSSVAHAGKLGAGSRSHQQLAGNQHARQERTPRRRSGVVALTGPTRLAERGKKHRCRSSAGAFTQDK